MAPHQDSPDVPDRAAQRRREADQLAQRFKGARRREALGEVLTYLSLFVLSGAYVLAAWLLVRFEQRQPRHLPAELQYASTDDLLVRYSLDFDDPGKIPAQARSLKPGSASLPSVVIQNSPGSLQFQSSPAPRQLPFALRIPHDAPPGHYSGVLRLADSGGNQLRNLLMEFTVADPMALVWNAGIVSLVMLAAGYLFLVWRRPAPCGRLLTNQVTPYGYNRRPDPRGVPIKPGVFRIWLWLPGRNRVSLRRLASGLPTGELVFERTGFRRVRMKAIIRSDPGSKVYQLRGWPSDTSYATSGNPGIEEASLDFPPRATTPTVIGMAPETNGRALTFSFQHPQSKKS